MTTKYRDLLDDPGACPWDKKRFRHQLRKAGTVADLKSFLTQKAARGSNHMFLAGSGQYHQKAEEVIVEFLCTETAPSDRQKFEKNLIFLVHTGVYFRNDRHRPYFKKQLKYFLSLNTSDQFWILKRLLKFVARVICNIGFYHEQTDAIVAVFTNLAHHANSPYKSCRTLLKSISLQYDPINEDGPWNTLLVAEAILEIVPRYHQ